MYQLDIDWSAAPEWAKWAARDADGDIFVFASRPECGSVGWFPVGPDRRCTCVTSQGDSDRDWRDTLTQRPLDPLQGPVDWAKAPAWAQWVVMEVDGVTWFRDRPPHRDASARSVQPQTVTNHQDNDGAGMLRAQLAHLLEDMTAEQLDALYAHVRKQLDAAKFDELNRHLDKPFGEVPREWQLKAFEAALDGSTVLYWAEDIEDERAGEWCPLAPLAGWSKAACYRIEPKQS